MGRAPCCEKVGLKRGPWTPEEDEKLVSFIKENGHGSWRALPKKAGLLRCGKSCRLRWTNYLRPDIKRGEFSASEENVILQLHALLGNRWSAIASHLPQRTDNEIKNYWNTHLKKKLVKMGLDPTTHKPLADSAVLLMNNGGSAAMAPNEKSGSVKLIDKSSNNKCSGGALNSGNDLSTTKAASNSSCIMNDQIGVSSAASLLLRGASPCNMKGSSATMHLTQWESVRLEAEARLTQEAKMRAKGVWPNIKHTHCATNSSAAGPASTASLSNLGHHGFQIHAGSHESCAGAASSTCKARSAVELMHALHNWEKSLQGQAGVLWPESWRVAANASAHSCCSHSESSSSSSPPAAPDHVQQAVAATSSASLCSLDSTRTPSRTADVGSTPMAGTSPPASKLSWSDALMPPKYPSSSSPKPTSDHICRVESSSRGSFSSLMLDAVLGRSLVAQRPIGVVHSPKLEVSGYGDYKEDKILGDESNHAAQHVDKHHVDEASNVSAVTGEMLQDDSASSDEDNGDENERSLSADGTSDLFRDLPRLKRDATTTPVSFTALLSEEISDYWSNMVLKEQIASPTIHISF